MYSIVSKEEKGRIIHFLADGDEDLVLIIDACDPGSTVQVLSAKGKDGIEGIHKYIKSPSGTWVLCEGDSDFKVPVNTVKVSVPAPTAEFGKKTADDFQYGVNIYPTGLVTGTLKSASSEIYGSGEEGKGHYFCATLNDPVGATTYTIKFENEEGNGKENNPVDGWLMVRHENMTEKESKGKESKTVTVTYNTGESFTFDLSHMTLE